MYAVDLGNFLRVYQIVLKTRVKPPVLNAKKN